MYRTKMKSWEWDKRAAHITREKRRDAATSKGGPTCARACERAREESASSHVLSLSPVSSEFLGAFF